MADEIKLNYPMAKAMAKTFVDAAHQIQETSQEALSIAGILEDGGLRGRAGEVFVEALRNQLVPALGRLNNKFDELSADVQKAIKFMEDADAESVRLQSS